MPKQLPLLSVSSYSSRTKLTCTKNAGFYKTKENFMNKLNIYMYESMLECEQEIRNEAHKPYMITSTNSYVVSVLVHDENEKTKCVSVQEIEELDSLDALRKRQATDCESVKKLASKQTHCFSRE